MAVHVRHSRGEQAAFALRHPGMAWRVGSCAGTSIEITPGEIARYLPDDPVIVEAGACEGIDTARFAQQWPHAVIHAFEPVPQLYAEVHRRTADLPGVRLYSLALPGRQDEWPCTSTIRARDRIAVPHRCCREPPRRGDR